MNNNLTNRPQRRRSHWSHLADWNFTGNGTQCQAEEVQDQSIADPPQVQQQVVHPDPLRDAELLLQSSAPLIPDRAHSIYRQYGPTENHVIRDADQTNSRPHAEMTDADDEEFVLQRSEDTLIDRSIFSASLHLDNDLFDSSHQLPSTSTNDHSSSPLYPFSAHDILEERFGGRIDDIAGFCATLFRKIKKLISRCTFTALLLLYGSIPVSSLQFQMISVLLSTFSESLAEQFEDEVDKSTFQLTSGITKTRRSVFPFFVSHVLPSTDIISTPSNKQSMKPDEDWLLVDDTV